MAETTAPQIDPESLVRNDALTADAAIGQYSVEMALSGFKTVTRSGLVLNVNDTIKVDATLEVGGLAETVTVGKVTHTHAETEKLLKHVHKTLSCEACHGPSQAHVDDPENGRHKPDKLNAVACLRCHEANPSRPKWHKQITLKSHYVGQKCTECHSPHQPNEVP